MQQPQDIWQKNADLEKWTVIGASVRGYTHIVKDIVRQDAAGYTLTKDGQALLVAVADGHGSDKYIYSDRGAKFAVESALEYLETLYENSKELGCKSDCLGKEWFLKKESLVYLWQKKVEDDWNSEETPEDLYEKYGTTILAALFTDAYIFLLHLGDGEIIYMQEDGQINAPVPKDPLCKGHSTTSICMPRSWEHIRTKLLKTENGIPKMFMFSSDGYIDSFETREQFYNDMQIYWNNFWKGSHETEISLPQWLQDISQKGSGDDISVILVFFNQYKQLVEKQNNQHSYEKIKDI